MKTGLVLAALAIAIFHPSLTQAQWQTDGVSVSAALHDQTLPVVIQDGAGGIIMAWQDARNGTDSNIYVQRVNGYGVAQWTADGVALCSATGDQVDACIVPDGAGGAIVAWRDARSNVSLYEDDIYAQRVNAAGVAQWAANGVALCTAASMQTELAIVEANGGSAIVVWNDWRVPAAQDGDLYAQRVSPTGAPLWGANGTAVALTGGGVPAIAKDGADGAIVAWVDYRAMNTLEMRDVYAQRLSPAGASLWTPGGTPLCQLDYDQDNISVLADGLGGAFVAWSDESPLKNILLQHVDSTGAPQWLADGYACDISATTTPCVGAKMVRDGSTGMIITWEQQGASSIVKAQRFNSIGTRLWNFGNSVSVAGGLFGAQPTIASDGVGGAIVAWQDFRNPTTDIYVQRLSTAGVRQYTSTGLAVCTAAGAQARPMIVQRDAGGVAIVWHDGRTPANENDIYAQAISLSGLIPTGIVGPASTPSLIVGNAYPNPFSGTTSFDVQLPRASDVVIQVVDVAGRRVREMKFSDVQRGVKHVDFDGLDSRGRRLANGVYFFNVTSAGETMTRKIVIAR